MRWLELEIAMTKKTILYNLFILLLTSTVYSQTATLINKLGSTALDKGNYLKEDGKIKLYGTVTNGPDTKNGDLACAKVVTIILQKAGVVDNVSVGVRHVESALKNWEKNKQ